MIMQHTDKQKLKQFLLLLGAVFFAVHQLTAQHFEYEWSEEQTYSNHSTGFFKGIVGANSTNVYMLQSNIEVTQPYAFDKVKITAFDRNNMTEIASVGLKGFKENKGQAGLYDSLNYIQTVVLDGKVVVFWRKLFNTDSLRTEELYAQTLLADLETGQPLTKLGTYEQKVSDHASDFDPTKWIILSNKSANQVVVGYESYSNQDIVFNYFELGNNLQLSVRKTCDLSLDLKQYPGGTQGTYELGKDGNIYIKSFIDYPKDDREILHKNQPKKFISLDVVNFSSGKHKQLFLKDNFKTITDFSVITTDSSSRVLGFFGDLKKDTSGIDKQGIFYVDVSLQNEEPLLLKFTYFEKTNLNKLFPKSKGGRKNSDQPTIEEQLQTRFDIEAVYPMKDGSSIFFFTRKYNYNEIVARSGLDGQNIYTTYQFCEKNNVSAIRLSAEGKIMWTSNIERSMTYAGKDIPDIRIIDRYGKFYVLFGTELDFKTGKKKPIPKSLLVKDLEYATFDPTSGRAKKFREPINDYNLQKWEVKYFIPTNVVALDDQFFFYQMKVKQHILWTVANVVCFPSIYYSTNTGNTKKGKATFTVLKVMEGKPEKKKRK